MQNSYSNQFYREESSEVTYAGFWTRLTAYIIDSILIFLGLLIVRLVMSGLMSVLRGTALGGNVLFHYTLKDVVLYVGQVLYFILCTYFTGTTVGKRAMNIRVINAKKDEKLTFFTVVYRETVGRFLSAFLLCIGYIMIGIDKEKRGMHDFLCDTRVIYAKKVKVYHVYQDTQVPNVSYGQNMAPVPQKSQITPNKPENEHSHMGYSYQEIPIQQTNSLQQNEESIMPQSEEKMEKTDNPSDQ